MRILPCLMSMTVATFVLTGCSTTAQNKSEEGASPGFLGNAYSKLEEVQSASGMKAMRWIAPGVNLSGYEAVMLDKSTFYPAPKATEQVSMATLNQITAYFDEALRRELKGVVKLVDEPGPKTLRFRPAITAAGGKNMGLKAYQMIPVAFIVTRGQTEKKASLAVEYELLDTESGKVIGAGMREGEGKELKSMEDKLTLDQLKPVIDTWAKDARAFMETARAKK